MRAAADARRERFKGFCRKVAEMSDAERAALLARVGSVMSCEGRALSETNSMLLILQRPGLPGVSIVGGFRQWKKAGRYVLKGERGLSVWVPRAGASGPPGLAGSELSRAELVQGAEGSGTVGALGARRRFFLGTVFDISQTAEIGADEPAAEEFGDGGEGDGEGSGPDSAPVAAGVAPVASAARSPVAGHDEAGGALVVPVAPVAVLPPERVKTIWDSPDGRGGPLLICAPPAADRSSPDAVAAPAPASGSCSQLSLF